jgi:hypothetical protein
LLDATVREAVAMPFSPCELSKKLAFQKNNGICDRIVPVRQRNEEPARRICRAGSKANGM